MLTSKEAAPVPPNESQFVGVFPAWPYANGPRHLGHGASLVPADVLARYYRAAGAEVLMASGTDEYGTPNVIAAEDSGLPTEAFVDKMNTSIREDFKAIGMSFDWFSRTTTEEHKQTAQELFVKLAGNNYLEKGVMLGSYDSKTGQSLPDRYVEGGCPACSAHSRGDQCENCSTLLDPSELVDPVSRVTGNPVQFKDTEHWFLKLDALAPELSKWVEAHNELRPNAKTSSLNQINELKPRAITRDMDWGVPLPRGFELEGGDNKVLYVWFEAVTGYLSASIEWAKEQGNPDLWKQWWINQDARHVYAMGKDNVPFHTIIWPAMLIGSSKGNEDKLHTPDQIASTEYLTLGEQKFSSSRNNTVYIKDLLEAVGPDASRFYLISNGPETKDKVFNVPELVTANNEELLSKWGNLVQRVITLTVSQNNGKVPHISPLKNSDAQQVMEHKITETYQETGELLQSARFSAAIRRVLDLCADTNRFLNDTEPWKTFKEDPESSLNSLYISLNTIDNISRMMAPFLPHSSQKVHKMLGYQTNIAGEIVELSATNGAVVLTGNYEGGKNIWQPTLLPGGQALEPSGHLFTKLDEKSVSEALA